MLKCGLGRLRPEQGQILIDGEDAMKFGADQREKVLRKFGMLFQGSALFDSLKDWENVAFGLIQGRRMKRDQAKQIALDKLGQVGLGSEVAELSPRSEEQTSELWSLMRIAYAVSCLQKHMLHCSL